MNGQQVVFHKAKVFKELQRIIQNVRNRFRTQCCHRTQTTIKSYEKFQTVLQKLSESNEFKGKLSAEEITSIFVDANRAGHYTNGATRLPSDRAIDKGQAQLMRKFSVAFQEECKNQYLTFSNTNVTNANGMRTKSVMNFLGVGDFTELQRIVNGAFGK